MAPPFVFPQILRALEEDPEDNHRLFAQNTVDVTSLRSSDLEEFVKGINTFSGLFFFSLECMSESVKFLRNSIEKLDLDLICFPI